MDKHQSRFQQGNALVEFILILGVLLPVALGTVMLGKLTDLQQTTEQAGRYTAWETTVYSRQALASARQNNVDQRFFRAASDLIDSRAETNQDSPSENTLWGASSATSAGLKSLASVSRANDTQVTAAYTFDTGKASASKVSGTIVSRAGELFDGFKGNSWGLVADGLLRSDIDVAVKPTGLLQTFQGQCGNNASMEVKGKDASAKSEGDHVCVRARGIILADGWSASGNKQMVSRVRSLVPSSALSTVGAGMSGLLGSLLFPELDPLDEAFGYVNISALPEYAKP